MTLSHTWAFSLVATELPDNTDLGDIRADLADDGVAAPEGKDQSELAAIVAQARADGIPLSVVVIQGNPWHDSSLRDLATEVGKFQHGTVAVFSDDWMGTYSDSISRVHLEWAEDAAKWKGGKSEESVQIFTDRLQQQESVPWTAFTSLLLAGTVLAVGGLYWVKRRRAASTTATADSADDSAAASV
ncbi:hypothetical protein GV794_12410 [Nocardia cyriacigeorgica]|uniref:Uncharacterized protein n=2 Tax=Nocardia cyriacigeorgica TaxID=135487 RepID=A0A6P1CY78_9NOCA|nr:hypothetical protein [Nocardia cyriacigeorgica]NEW42888.1 hypothetical protein [Nocardia cyriacigeorgica]NEW56447.1 hypothetical protein [Nocardia cyriacigeorgica]